MLTSEQLRAARAALRMEQATLAQESGVSVETIKRLERMDGELRAQRSTINDIRTAMERHGVVFLDAEYDEAPGIRVERDPSKALRTAIVSEVASSADVILNSAFRDDDQFYVRGRKHVINTLTQSLPSMLEEFLKGTIEED